MYKIAIISAGILPIPAVRGGAVEALVTNLIEENEDKKKFYFDVYTCDDIRLKTKRYKETNIVIIKPDKFLCFCCKVLQWLKFHIGIGRSVSPYNVRLYLKSSWKQYDYILVENPMKTYEVLYSKKVCRDKLLYHMHNDIESDEGDKSKKRTELIVKTAKLYLTCSNYLKSRVKEEFPFADVSVLYNCVDLEQFSTKAICSQKVLKEKYHIKETDKIVLYAGRIEQEKGIKELLLAFLQLKEEKNIKLLFVGNCSCDKENTNYINEVELLLKQLGKQIIVTGFIESNLMQEYYALSDIVVIPTMSEEAFGMVAAEAMAMQKPLIVTKSGGLPEIVDETCAVILDKDENFIDNLSEEIKRLMKECRLRQEMGKAAYQRILSKTEFHKCNYYNNFYKLIESIEEST